MSATTTAPSLADRFAQIIEGVRRGMSVRANAMSPAGLLLLVIGLRLMRMRRQFAALFDKMLAGKLRPPRARKLPPSPRPATSRPAATPDQPKLPPQTSGWLIRLLPEPWHVNYWRVPLEQLLADPDLATMLQTAPQLGRILRPLCRMLNMDVPAMLALPRRSRKPAPRRERKPRPVNPDRLSRLALARLLRTPRDNNTPPIEIAYARGYRPPKPDPV